VEEAALAADTMLQASEPGPREALDVTAERGVELICRCVSLADAMDGRLVLSRMLRDRSLRPCA
jgi:hypothetical protein